MISVHQRSQSTRKSKDTNSTNVPVSGVGVHTARSLGHSVEQGGKHIEAVCSWDRVNTGKIIGI